VAVFVTRVMVVLMAMRVVVNTLLMLTLRRVETMVRIGQDRRVLWSGS